MPLASGSSNAAVSANVKTELAAGKPQAQAVAIAMQHAHRPASHPMQNDHAKMAQPAEHGAAYPPSK